MSQGFSALGRDVWVSPARQSLIWNIPERDTMGHGGPVCPGRWPGTPLPPTFIRQLIFPPAARCDPETTLTLPEGSFWDGRRPNEWYQRNVTCRWTLPGPSSPSIPMLLRFPFLSLDISSEGTALTVHEAAAPGRLLASLLTETGPLTLAYTAPVVVTWVRPPITNAPARRPPPPLDVRLISSLESEGKLWRRGGGGGRGGPVGER